MLLAGLVILVLALPPQSAHDNPYYTSYTSEYAYKVLKGLVWGVSLVPMWGYLLAVDKRRATRLTIGLPR